VPGKGSTFEVYLPLIAAPARQAQAAPAAPCAFHGTGEHVLYVDDDQAMTFMVRRMLRNAGYRVSGCANGNEALAAVRGNTRGFDLAVVDFNMPGISGVQVAHELARIQPGLPVVITSGHITEELQAGAAAAGVRALVHKAEAVDELCRVIQRVLAAQQA
jgi:CheY-like chemotaxis protein